MFLTAYVTQLGEELYIGITSTTTAPTFVDILYNCGRALQIFVFGTTTLLCNATMSARANSHFAQLVTRASDTASDAATPARATMSRESLDALEAAAARRRAAAAVVPRVEAPAPPPAEAEPSEAPVEPITEASPPAEAEPSADAELSEAPEPAGAEPRAESPATAEVEPRADSEAEPSAETPPPADAGPRVEAPAPEAEPCAEDTFDWHAKPGPAKFAAFMEAFPPEKYGGPAYVPALTSQRCATSPVSTLDWQMQVCTSLK